LRQEHGELAFVAVFGTAENSTAYQESLRIRERENGSLLYAKQEVAAEDFGWKDGGVTAD